MKLWSAASGTGLKEMGLFAQLSLLTGSDIKETEIRKLSVALRGATFQRRPRSFKSMFESFNGPTTTTPQSMEPVGGGRVRLRKCIREKKGNWCDLSTAPQKTPLPRRPTLIGWWTNHAGCSDSSVGRVASDRLVLWPATYTAPISAISFDESGRRRRADGGVDSRRNETTWRSASSLRGPPASATWLPIAFVVCYRFFPGYCCCWPGAADSDADNLIRSSPFPFSLTRQQSAA